MENFPPREQAEDANRMKLSAFRPLYLRKAEFNLRRIVFFEIFSSP
jgi:hypothetical protein